MIMMQGNDRVFDKVITEGGTAAARTISLYGVKALSDLQGVSLIIRANIGGSNSATTMKVNNLTATKLSVFKNGGIADADANWIVSGQLYMLYYNGVQFIAFPMSASSGSSNSSVEFADFPIDVLNLNAQSSESNISSAFGGPAKMAEFDALVQAGTKIIRFTNVDSFVYYIALYYRQINIENTSVNDIVIVLHNYTDRTDLEAFTFIGTMTEDGDFEKYTEVVKRTLYSSSQEGTLNNPRAFTGDANTKTTPGVYAITPFSNVPSNIPSGVSYGTMIVTTDEDASTITQTLQTSNTVYFRCKYSTNDWGEWVDLGASSGGGSSSGGMKTFEIDHGDLANMRNAGSESDILAIWDDTKQSEFVEAMDDPDTIIVIKYTDDQYITSRDYIVCKTGFYGGIGYSQYGQTQYISFTYLTGLYLYSYTFHFNFETDHISSVTRSFIDLSKIEDEMIIETDQATSLSFNNQTGNRGILAVSGNQEQEIREGYNILDYLPNIRSSMNGLTIKKDEETGYVTIDGTPNADYTVILSKTIDITDFLEDGQIYTLWQETHNLNLGGIYLQVMEINKDESGMHAYYNSSGINRTFTVNKSLYNYRVSIQTETIAQAGTFMNYKNRYMIYKGTDEKEFELYGASPSPGYSSEVKCLGSNKNLLDLKSQTSKGITSTKNADGTISLIGTASETGVFSFLNQSIILKANKTYTFSLEKISGQSITNAIWFWNETDSNSEITLNLTNNKKTVTFTKDTTLSALNMSISQGNVFDITLALKVEEGTEATSCSPYGQGSTNIKVLQYEKEYVNKTLPIQQEMLQGDYFIKEADDWKEVHYHPKLVFTGEENWYVQNPEDPSIFQLTLSSEYNLQQSTEEGSAFCNYFKQIQNEQSLKTQNGISIIYQVNTSYIRINNLNITNVEDFKSWLQQKYLEGNPVYIFYKSATPIKIPCTEEQSKVLDELNSLTMKFGENNVITLENIALLQMTLVDSQLNDVIEASMPIVNSEVGTILNPNALTSTNNLNDVKTSGIYSYTTSSTPVNAPSGTSYGTLYVNKISDKEITQMVISPSFSEGSSTKDSNIWFRYYGTHSDNQTTPEWSSWNMLLMTNYGNKYRYMKPYLLSYYKFDYSLNSDSTQTDIENAFGSLEKEQEFIAAMNDENTNIILYYNHESNEREYWYTISKMVDNGNYHRLILCSGNSSESMTAGSISFKIYSFKYDDINNVYTAFNREDIDVSSSSGAVESANKLTTARNITITGDETCYPVAFDGTKDISLLVTRKGASVGQYSDTTTNPWYKVADIDIVMNNQDRTLIMMVYGTYNLPYAIGILRARVRTSTISSDTPVVADLTWILRGNSVDSNKFRLCYKIDEESNMCTAELWVCIDDFGYLGYNFDVISEGSRTKRGSGSASIPWNMYNTWSAGSQASYPSEDDGYSSVASTALLITNAVNNANKLTTPRNINGVAFDGSANINITANPTSNQLTNEDLNGMKEVQHIGFYYAVGGNSVVNRPSNVNNFGLSVYRIGQSYFVQELYTGDSNEVKYYTRVWNSSTWSDWEEMKFTDTTYGIATTATNGLMSKEDKVKLNGIATGATANSASTTTPKANGTAAVGTDTKFARGDHVHPAQTTITGNAGSATKLQTARTINGVAFNGTANINTFDSSYKVPGCYRMKSTSNPQLNLPGGNNFIPLENFPMYSELGTNPLFTLNSDGTITVNKTCMLDFRGTWSVYGSGNIQNKIYSNITYYDSDMQGWMPLYSSPLVPTSTVAMTSYDADFGPGQMGMVMAGTKIRASLDSTNDTSGAVFSGQINGYSLFINVIYVKG